MLFIDYSSAFSTTVPSKLIIKLTDLVRLDPELPDGQTAQSGSLGGSTTSSTLTLNTRDACSALSCTPCSRTTVFLVLHHQAQGQLHPSGCKTAELLSVTSLTSY